MWRMRADDPLFVLADNSARKSRPRDDDSVTRDHVRKWLERTPRPVLEAYARVRAGDAQARADIVRHLDALDVQGRGGGSPDSSTLARDWVLGAHALAELDLAAGEFEAARSWLRRIKEIITEAALEPELLVSLGPEIFGERSRFGGWEEDPVLWVVSPTDEAVAEVLHELRVIFSCITDTGSIVEDPESTDQYTPNYVSPVYETPAGPLIYADTKGVTTPEMAKKIIEVLVRALRDAGVAAIVATPPEFPDERQTWRPSTHPS